MQAELYLHVLFKRFFYFGCHFVLLGSFRFFLLGFFGATVVKTSHAVIPSVISADNGSGITWRVSGTYVIASDYISFRSIVFINRNIACEMKVAIK